MTAHDPIKRVSVVSTGTVQIRPEHVGPTRKSTYRWLATSHRWTDPRPINAYVIEHRDGLVLFDTGQDRASVTDPGYFPSGVTGVVYDRLARFDIGPDQTLPGSWRQSSTTSATSGPLCCRTCTRITSEACPSCRMPTSSSASRSGSRCSDR